MDGPSWELAIAFLPPLAAAGLTSMGLWFSERLKDRDAAQRRLKAISEELTRVQYLRSWLKTYDLISGTVRDGVTGARDGVCRDLIDSHNRLSLALQQHPGEDVPSAAYRAWKRALLVPLKRPMSRALRWGYWFFLVLSIVLTLAFMTSGYETTDGSPSSPLTVFASGLILFVPFFAVALIFRAGALALEHRYLAGRTSAQITPPPAPGATSQFLFRPSPAKHPQQSSMAPPFIQGSPGGAPFPPTATNYPNTQTGSQPAPMNPPRRPTR